MKRCKPSVGLLDATHGCGTNADKAIVEANGADPNFISDLAVRKSTRLCLYEQGFHPANNPGQMWYICKVPDCTTFGGAWLCFNAEEVLVAHWNTLHAAVLP